MKQYVEGAALPSFIDSKMVSDGIILSWYRPDWKFIAFYAAIFLLGAWVGYKTVESGGYFLSDDYAVSALGGMLSMSAAGAALWGFAGAAFNREKVVLANSYIARITRPLQMLNQRVSFSLNLLGDVLIEERGGNVSDLFDVLLVKHGGRTALFLTTYDEAIATAIADAIKSHIGLMDE